MIVNRGYLPTIASPVPPEYNTPRPQRKMRNLQCDGRPSRVVHSNWGDGMRTTEEKTDRPTALRVVIWFGILGALLAVVNNGVAILALGVFQGLIVAFTTPFALTLAKLRYPGYPGATIVFLPLVAASIFTVNFGPPGPYKLCFVVGPILYDLACYLLRVQSRTAGRIRLWKLIVATVNYPIGLLLGGLVALTWVTSDVPMLAHAWKGAIALVVVFGLMGSLATTVAYRVYYKWLQPEQ
jgi:hypothetical protein